MKKHRSWTPAPAARTSKVRQYLIVFGVALALRVTTVFALNSLAIWRTPCLDSLEYFTWASRIAGGDFTWPVYAAHAPGYPYLLAGMLAAFGSSIAAAHVVHAFLGSFCCVLTARLAARTTTPAALLPAGLAQAIYAPLIVHETAILAEGPFLLALLVALNLAVADSPGGRRGIVFGLALGAAAVIRPTALVLFPALCGLILVREHVRPRAWRFTASALVGVALVTAPVLWKNWRANGTPAIQAFGGMNFYLGNSPAGTGRATARPGDGWDALEGDAGRAGLVAPADVDSYYVSKALDEIRRAPLAYVRLLGNKLVWLTQAEEVRDSHSFYFFASAFSVLPWLPGFGMLLSLGMVGLVEAVRRRALSGYLLLYLLAIGGTCLFLVIGSRYRLPLVPAMMALAGAGMVWFWEQLHERRWAKAGMLLSVACLTLVLAHLRVDASSHDFSEEWAFTGLALKREHDPSGAEAAYRRAIEINGRKSFAWDGLGLLKLDLGRPREARSALETAVAINPANAEAWQHLGLVLEELGDRREAIAAYRKSLSVAPERTDAIEALGQALLVSNELPEARVLLTKVAERDTNSGTARFGLALIALQQGRADEAFTEARAAVRLMPTYARARLLLARSAVAAGQLDVADEELDAAERLAAPPVEVAAGRVKVSLVRGRRGEVESWLNRMAETEPATAAAIWREAQSWPNPLNQPGGNRDDD